MDLSNKLKEFFEYMKYENITAVEIANKIGISKKTLSNYINGDAYIPLKHLNNISNILDVSVDYIIGLSKNKKYDDSIKIDNLDSKLIGKRLKDIRKELKLSQSDLANIIGINKSSISRYESGESLILTICLYTICYKYNISVDYILGKTEENNLKK